ncbi:MAG TPA: SLC13 family permease [Terriglobales bacterium]|nr:SLC13 family permease [Terriglobales bacterium]
MGNTIAAADKKYKNDLLVSFIAFAIFLFTYLGPIPATMTRGLFMLIGTVVLSSIMWLLIGINWTNYFILLTLILNPDYGLTKVRQNSFGNSTVFFFICAFALVSCLLASGVTKRLAVLICTSKWSKKGPWWRVFTIFLATWVLCQGLASTTILVISYALVEAILGIAGYNKGDETGKMMIHGTGIIAQSAMGMTPIAHIVAINAVTYYNTYTGNELDFLDFCLIGIPMGILIFALFFMYFRFVWKPEDLDRLSAANYDELRTQLGPWTKQEKIVGVTYIVAIIFWILPGLGKYIPGMDWLSNIDNCTPPLVAVTFLALMRVEGKPLFDYKRAITKDIPWITLMFSATLNCVGNALSNTDIGFSVWATATFSPIMGNFSPFLFVCIILVGSLVLTNFISNNVTLAIAFAVGFPIAANIFQGKVSVVGMAILLAGTCNLGIATPPACTPIAMAELTGWTDTKSMWKHGWRMVAIASLVYCFVAYPLSTIVLGLR